jgi:small subunit ribosomal protein S4
MRKGFKPRYKACFQLNVNLWARPKLLKFTSNKWKGINKKSPYSILGQKNSLKYSHLQPNARLYGLRLKSKQLVKKYYGGIKEKQLQKYYLSTKGFGDNSKVFSLLECRLDITLYRMFFATTLFEARQYINHGFIKVNGIRVKQKSHLLREGDMISIDKKYWSILSIKIHDLLNKTKSKALCSPHLQVDYFILEGFFISMPEYSKIMYPVLMDPNLAKEYYK